MFSKACEYGIKAAVYISIESQRGKRVSLNDIAKKINSPTAFTAKVLQQLSRNELVTSVKGPSGGFEINKEGSDKIKLSDIVSAIDGDSIYAGCALGFKKCGDTKPCPVHHRILKVRNDLRHMLETTSVLDLTKDIHKGMAFLKA